MANINMNNSLGNNPPNQSDDQNDCDNTSSINLNPDSSLYNRLVQQINVVLNMVPGLNSDSNQSSNQNPQNQNDSNSNRNRNPSGNQNTLGQGNNQNPQNDGNFRQSNQDGNQKNFGLGNNQNPQNDGNFRQSNQDANRNNFGQSNNQNPQNDGNFGQSNQDGNRNNFGQTNTQNPQNDGNFRQFNQDGNRNNFGQSNNQNPQNDGNFRQFNQDGTSSNSNTSTRYDATIHNFFNGTKYNETYGWSPNTVSVQMPDGTPKIVSKEILDLIVMTCGANNANILYMKYKDLKTKIRVLDYNCDEYNKICQYFNNSKGPTHNQCNLEIDQIFKISRRGEFKTYKHYKDTLINPKLLWFGTKSQDFSSILKNGFHPPQQPFKQKNDYPFSPVLYFTDCVTKASQKCDASPQNPYGLLLLTEVMLGHRHLVTKGMTIPDTPPPGKSSVKSYGKYQQDVKSHLYTYLGVQVPWGKIRAEYSAKGEPYNYNAYYIYDRKQVLNQFLVKVKFNYKN